MKIVIASFEGMPEEFRDDELLLELLGESGIDAEARPWNDPAVDWDAYDLVVARTVWDYTFHYTEFCTWVRRVRAPLENDPELIVWNSDKRYMGDLATAGVPVVETTYVEPGGEPPAIDSEIVVKPTISAGGRDTGRFGPASVQAAQALISQITESGRTAMIQPYIASVDARGETAVVTIDGSVSHVLRKRAILRPDEVAPLRDDGLGAAEVMYDPELVLAGSASEDELELTDQVLALIQDRFGTTPLYARVDMLRGPDGTPLVLELEAIEPNLYFDQAPGSAQRLAEAIVARARLSADATPQP